MPDRIPFNELVEKLTAMASETKPAELSYRAFWIDSGNEIAMALRDGTEALLQLAADEGIGIQLNAGWRCDIDLKRFSVEACDNQRRGNREEFPIGTIHAATAQGALAAAILAVLQARAANGEDRSHGR